MRKEIQTHLLSGWFKIYFILCNIKRDWCLLTESATPSVLNSSSSLIINCPALTLRDPRRWAHKSTAWTSWSLLDVIAEESRLNKTLCIFEMMMFSGSSGSSARSGSKPSRSMCSAITQIRRAQTLGVFTCQMVGQINIINKHLPSRWLVKFISLISKHIDNNIYKQVGN